MTGTARSTSPSASPSKSWRCSWAPTAPRNIRTAVPRRLRQRSSMPEIAEARVVDEPSPQRPVERAVALGDRDVVDGGQAPDHQPVVAELPVLVAVGAEPVAGVVVMLVGEAHGDAPIGERPELLDEPVVQLPGPLARQERDDLVAARHELGAVAPPAVRRVRQRDLAGVAGVPPVLGQPDLLDRRLL